MKVFKVGDRVRVLDVDRSISPSMEVTDKGTITDINTVSPSAVRVKCDTWKNHFNNGSWFHVRQIRKLIKKRKVEWGRGLWVRTTDGGMSASGGKLEQEVSFFKPKEGTWVFFRESTPAEMGGKK